MEPKVYLASGRGMLPPYLTVGKEVVVHLPSVMGMASTPHGYLGLGLYKNVTSSIQSVSPPSPSSHPTILKAKFFK